MHAQSILYFPHQTKHIWKIKITFVYQNFLCIRIRQQEEKITGPFLFSQAPDLPNTLLSASAMNWMQWIECNGKCRNLGLFCQFAAPTFQFFVDGSTRCSLNTWLCSPCAFKKILKFSSFFPRIARLCLPSRCLSFKIWMVLAVVFQLWVSDPR